MPTRRKSDQELLKVLKIMEAARSGLFYHLCASLHSSSPSDRGEHSQELMRLIASARSRTDRWVQLAWPRLADADVILRCDQIKQKLAPIATMISPAIEKLRPIVSNEWPLLDGLVENSATLVDDSRLLAKLTQYLQELNKIGPAKLCKIEQQLSQLERQQGNAPLSSTDDLEPEILWVIELTLLLKLGFSYLAKLYLGYAFLAYVLFTYTLSEVFGAMQQSGQCLRDFISGEDGLSHDYWRTQLRPALLDLSHDASLLRILTVENEAMIEFLEARYELGGNMEKALNILWDLGVRAGGKPIRWTEVVAQLHEIQVNEGLQDSLYRLITVLDDYVDKKEFAAILGEGAEGKLLNSLRKATWHDFLDEKKRTRADKRKVKVVLFSQLSEYQGNGDKGLPFDEVAGRIAQREADDAFERTEARLTLEKLVQVPELTHREQEALLLTMALARGGEEPTLEKIGKLMGVTKGTVKKLRDRVYRKLRRYALRV